MVGTAEVRLKVALVAGLPAPKSFEEDCLRPYTARPTVEVIAAESDSLSAVLRKATEEFQLAIPGDYEGAGESLAFYQGDSQEVVVPTLPTTKTVTVTNRSGLAVWHVGPEHASVSELVEAKNRKVLRGDPLRPYLLVDPDWRMGGPTPGGWDTFVQIWTALLVARGSWDLLRETTRVSKQTIYLLERAAARWERHRSAAWYTRELFEGRGADIMDVVESARAAMTYQLQDIMAWTGVDEPSVAADIAGWAGYDVDPQTYAVTEMTDHDLRDLLVQFPISLSIDELPTDEEEAHRETMTRLGWYLHERGLADPE